jgi:hypothetical protein
MNYYTFPDISIASSAGHRPSWTRSTDAELPKVKRRQSKKMSNRKTRRELRINAEFKRVR